jgi:predicted O-linked N-acetylglucosamine transferase (SPINDLY family)
MEILHKVPKSVLWLYRSGESAVRRLWNKAGHYGVSADRLIFADKMPLGDHLNRLKRADLALDTFIYNGGATTANALTAGVPLITSLGGHFLSRMSASHLMTVRLENLIVADLQDYVRLAVDLAQSPERLKAVRQTLKNNLITSPLLDTKGFVRNLEKAYRLVWDQYRTGRPPEQLDIAP